MPSLQIEGDLHMRPTEASEVSVLSSMPGGDGSWARELLERDGNVECGAPPKVLEAGQALLELMRVLSNPELGPALRIPVPATRSE
jgi:hypothetical protein